MEVVQHLQAALIAQVSFLKTFLRSYTSSKYNSTRLSLLKAEYQLHKYDTVESHLDEYNSAAIVIDMFQKAVSFTVYKGFSSSEVHHFLDLYLHTLSLISQSQQSDGNPVSVTLTLPNILEDFKIAVLEYTPKLSHAHLLDSVTYITDTVFQHFNLYQFLLTQNQPVDLTTVKLDLHIPAPPQPLIDAMPEQEWIKKEKIALLTAKQNEKEKQFTETCEYVVKVEEDKLRETYQTELAKVAGQSEITEEDIRKVVESLTEAHLASTKVAISQVVEKHSLVVGMKTEKLEVLSPKHNSENNKQVTVQEE